MPYSNPAWFDQLFTAVCVGKPRWAVELCLLIISGALIHFGYSFLNTRHAQSANAKPSDANAVQQVIQTGPIITHGSNSGVVIGQDSAGGAEKK
jgi:hypothetical protein